MVPLARRPGQCPSHGLGLTVISSKFQVEVQVTRDRDRDRDGHRDHDGRGPSKLEPSEAFPSLPNRHGHGA